MKQRKHSWSFGRVITLLFVCVPLLVACSGYTGEQREARLDSLSEPEAASRASGAIGGLAVGAMAGYALAGSGAGGMVAGAALGGFGASAGMMLADMLIDEDRASFRTTLDGLATANTGEPIAWQSKRTASRGSITPLRSFLDESGRVCRDYRAHLVIEGVDHSAVETACLTSVGSWVVYAEG